MNTADSRYTFVRATPSRGELRFMEGGKSSEAQEVIAFVAICSADRLPLEVISLNAGDLASIPASVNGEVTKVRFVGEAPLTSLENDPFNNMQVAIRKNSALEVVFKVFDHKKRLIRKKKIFTTVS